MTATIPPRDADTEIAELEERAERAERTAAQRKKHGAIPAETFAFWNERDRQVEEVGRVKRESAARAREVAVRDAEKASRPKRNQRPLFLD